MTSITSDSPGQTYKLKMTWKKKNKNIHEPKSFMMVANVRNG